MHDYYRIYDIPTVVFRQSCIYGYRQFGIEDQGWIAWFIIAALKGKSITIYGDGKQVRDILFIDDLIDAYLAALNNIEATRGNIYNIGGGPKNSMSVWTEFGPILERLMGCKVPVKYDTWRPGDQTVYISNIDKARNEFGWSPKISVEDGISKLYFWVKNNIDLFNEV
jgi:CDP-paratose 2-epimerase